MSGVLQRRPFWVGPGLVGRLGGSVSPNSQEHRPLHQAEPTQLEEKETARTYRKSLDTFEALADESELETLADLDM